MKAKIIIGANYGDEGKGLAAHFFAAQSRTTGKRCLNILYNGGAQRGHTVEMKTGARHVFHHFGAGTFDNANTFFDRDFMVNPLMFVKEYEDLKQKYEITPTCFVSPSCRVVTPLDMLLNQMREGSRGHKRHGSCGQGIFETRKRYEDSTYHLNYGELLALSHDGRLTYFSNMLDGYSKEKLAAFGCDIPYEDHKGAIYHFVNDLESMISVTEIAEYGNILGNYDMALFEGAQGLALSEDAPVGFPHLTPSKTTSERPFEVIEENGIQNTEVCYVTRSYLTRHGAGDLPGECPKHEINEEIEDLTNIPNENQGTIRYARLDEDAMFERINRDAAHHASYRRAGGTVGRSVMVTHLNYYDADSLIGKSCEYFDHIYLSSSKYAEDIVAENS